METNLGMREKSTMRLRLTWPDLYRSLAMVLIVAYHMVYPLQPQLGTLGDYVATLSESGTLMFVLLSGFLFGYKENTKGYWGFVHGKFVQLFLPYMVASALVIGLRLIRHSEFNLLDFSIELLWAIPFGRAAAPFWFIPMLMGFFLIEPLWRWLNKKAWSSYLYWGLLFLPFAVGRGQAEELGRNVLYFLPFFAFGIEFARHGESWAICLQKSKWILLIGAMSLLLVLQITPSGALATLIKMLWGSALLGFCLRVKTPSNVLSANSRNTMMVYLYHNSMIGVIFVPLFAKIPSLSPAVWVAILLCSAILGTLSLSFAVSIFARILDRLGLKKHKWLLGF